MRLSKFLSALLLTVAVVIAAPSTDALVKKSTQAKAGKTVKKIAKSKNRKKVPFILAPKTPEILSPETPHQHHISPEFSDTLARGDLNQAYRTLQLEEASDKVGYMINQVLMAQGKGAAHGAKVSAFDRGTAWHNLYLFLQRQGRPAPKFVKEAAKYYRKAERSAGNADKVNILLAALYASEKDTSKSEKYFNRVNIAALTHNGDDYNGLEYLALYYAANKQTDKTIVTLNQAYKLNPGPLLQWLHVGDDFQAIADDPVYQEQLAQWTEQHHQRLSQLQRDKSTHGARKKAALTKKSKKKHGKKRR